jgi:transcription elongation factor Elf1
MKSSSAKDVLAEFFELEETASGYIASCPACGVRFAVNVKRDVVADDYVRLLVEHANEERVTFASDEEIRDWLRSGEAKTKSFLSTLQTAVAQADRCEYKVLRPALFDLKAKCSETSSAVSTNPLAESHRSLASAKP